jgi:hypothetical protein
MIFLKQSTASQEVPLGYFVDSTDGNTEETGLSIANTDIKVWKTGATTLANKNSGGATHISNGIYYAVLDATDTDTLGPLVIFVHVSGALTVRLECCVLAANVYDSLVGATDKLDVNTIEIAGSNVSTSTAQIGVNVVNAGGTAWGSGAITSGVFGVGAITASAIAADAIGSSELATDAVTEIAAGVWNSARVTYNTAGSFGEGVSSVQGNVTGSVNSVTSGVTVTTNNDKTGYSLANNSITANVIASDAITEIQTGLATSANITSLNNISTTDVKNQVVAALSTDTYAEPGQDTPASTTNLAAKINYLYKAWRNKVTQTSSEYKLFNDDGTTVGQKATVSDNGTTFQRDEIVTGP